MKQEKITLSQLEGFLFKSADILRGKMDSQLANPDPDNKADKKKITALNKDKAVLESGLAKTGGIFGSQRIANCTQAHIRDHRGKDHCTAQSRCDLPDRCCSIHHRKGAREIARSRR
ncbi:MAG: hypothetical protein ACXQTY_02005 [Candidatus Methanogasteraceae archaeon]